jgi:hypothetical protein
MAYLNRSSSPAMNPMPLCCLLAWLAPEPSQCLTLAIERHQADKAHIYLVLTAPCKQVVHYKCWLEMQVAKGDWVRVQENVQHRVDPPYQFSTPLIELRERRKTIRIAYPAKLSPRYGVYNFRVKAQYVSAGRNQYSFLQTAAFCF